MPATRRRVLYVTYDGLTEQLGQSQILPYVLGLARLGHRFEILSFEKPGIPLRYREEIADGVCWTALRYHRTPTVPATLFDVGCGLAGLSVDSLLGGVDLLHVRSYLPCVIALPLAEAARIPLLFDMRGLWGDEKVDSGSWRAESGLYRTVKRVERVLLRRADATTTLTLRLQRYLRSGYPFADEIRGPIRVIPTCVDLQRFTPTVAPDAKLSGELAGFRVLLYLGAIGGYYMPRQLGEFYLAWRKYAKPARLLVVSRHDAGEIRSVLREAGVEDEMIERSASREEVPSLIRCAEASFGLYRSGPLAAHGTAATKTGEALACGIPFASANVGDLPLQLGDSPCGVLVRSTRPEDLDDAAKELVRKAEAPDVAFHARRLAEDWYSLEAGVSAYDELYQAMPRRHRGRVSVADGGWPPVSVSPVTRASAR